MDKIENCSQASLNQEFLSSHCSLDHALRRRALLGSFGDRRRDLRPLSRRRSARSFSLAELQNGREKASAAFINRISKPCPRYYAKIEKTSGCNHMTCRECHCDWCWLCGQDITVNGVTEHFSTTTAIRNPSPCTGLQFLLVEGYERMPDDDPELAAELQAWVVRRHQEQERAQRPGGRADDRCRRFCYTSWISQVNSMLFLFDTRTA